jgi:anti-sigma-K factor RskA
MMIDEIEKPVGEDEFLSFVKSGLEEGIEGTPRLAEIERAARPKTSFWRYSWLAAAASVAVVLSFAFLDFGRKDSSEATVAQVIELLSTVDGDENSVLAENDLPSLILAWQDAPYESAISDLAL